MKHTEIFDEYPDIVTIRHCQAAEITKENIRENLQKIQTAYPQKRLLLIDHCYSYSFTCDAVIALKQLTYFNKIASLVYSEIM